MVATRTRTRTTLIHSRVQKKVWTCASGTCGRPVEVRRFLWSGWLLLMELDGMAGGIGVSPVRKYTWGLNLAGQSGAQTSGLSMLEGAGGIGGLLAVSDPNDPNDPNDPFGDFVCFYDGNGNVAQVVDLAHDANDPAGAIVAKYEYDPYGQRINYDPQVPEYDQPWRFSTKQFDAETGLGYWGYRYYSPGLGRWISRDPMEERGALNVYAAFNGNSLFFVDALGLSACESFVSFIEQSLKLTNPSTVADRVGGSYIPTEGWGAWLWSFFGWEPVNKQGEIFYALDALRSQPNFDDIVGFNKCLAANQHWNFVHFAGLFYSYLYRISAEYTGGLGTWQIKRQIKQDLEQLAAATKDRDERCAEVIVDSIALEFAAELLKTWSDEGQRSGNVWKQGSVLGGQLTEKDWRAVASDFLDRFDLRGKLCKGDRDTECCGCLCDEAKKKLEEMREKVSKLTP